jgi:flagellar basal body-associated protein FliL
VAQEQSPEGAEPAKKGKSLLENKLLVIAAIVLAQGGMGFAAAKFLIAPAFAPPAAPGAAQGAGHGGGEPGPDGAAAAPASGPLVSLNEMVISLSATGKPRYLRTTIALEARDAAVAKEIEERLAKFRDIAIMRLSSHAPGDLDTFEGKEAVKADIKTALAGDFKPGDLLNIYFSDFVVQ